MPDSARWCSQCGTPLNTTPQQPSQQSPYNPQNQTPNQYPYSGGNATPQPGMPQPPKQGNKSLTIAIWVVAALLLVGIILYFFTQFNKGNDNISLDDSLADTAYFADNADPWAELDKQRQQAKETVRIIEQQEEPKEAVSWTQRTISGKYYDSTGDYPVRVTFEENGDGQIRNATFNNVNYGGKIPLRGRSTSDGYTFSGSAGGQSVTVTFENVGGQLQGRANIGGHEITLTATIY